MSAFVMYLVPIRDAQCAEDEQRFAGRADVRVYELSFLVRVSVQQVVRILCHPHCVGLVLPDDPMRHNEMIEHVKACALHVGHPVQPLTHFLANKPAAACAVPATQHHAVAGKPSETLSHT